MPLSITLTAGYTFAPGELVTEDKLNLMGNPTIDLSGSISSFSIADGSVTTPKLADGALSADSTGRAKMADLFLTLAKINLGIFTADTAGRAPFASKFVNGALMDDNTRLSVPAYVAGVFAANVYAMTLSPAIAAYTEGMTVRMKPDTTNAGACNVNLNGLGSKSIKKNINQDPAAGDITANEVVTLTYDGTNFQLSGRRPAPSILGSAKNLQCAPNAGAASSKADLTVDEMILKDANSNTYLASAVSVTADITTSGANGLDTGAEASSTWYYLWVIYNPATATVASLLSASSTAPTLPSGYTYKALAGVVRNDGSSNFVPFLQQDREVFIDDTAVFTAKASAGADTYEAYSAGAGGSDVNLNTVVPPLAKRLRGTLGATTNNNHQMGIAGDASGLGAVSVVCAPAGTVTVNGFNTAAFFSIPLKTAQTFYWKAGDTVARSRLTVSGYSL